MKMIVGLGNPGPQYAVTKHNVGFMIADNLVEIWQGKFSPSKFNAEVAEVRVGREKVLLVKPQTFMNLSGQAVGALARWFKIEAAEILVMYDDLDLDLGRLRFRQQGSSGGHNGIKSIISHLGTEAFPRLKVGIGRPKPGQQTADYVLSLFGKSELAVLEETIEQACSGVQFYLESGIEAAMNQYNVKK